MAGEDIQYQLVTFQLGEELYGVNIMDVKEIVKTQPVRPLPNAPYYVEGIFNLRKEIIPVISLHKRFRLKKAVMEDGEDEGGFVILNIDGNRVIQKDPDSPYLVMLDIRRLFNAKELQKIIEVKQ